MLREETFTSNDCVADGSGSVGVHPGSFRVRLGFRLSSGLVQFWGFGSGSVRVGFSSVQFSLGSGSVRVWFGLGSLWVWFGSVRLWV